MFVDVVESCKICLFSNKLAKFMSWKSNTPFLAKKESQLGKANPIDYCLVFCVGSNQPNCVLNSRDFKEFVLLFSLLCVRATF